MPKQRSSRAEPAAANWFSLDASQLGAAYDGLPVGIYVLDVTGNCIYANAMCLQMTGHSFAALRNSGWRTTCVHPEDRDLVAREWKRALEPGGGLVVRFVRSSGEPIWVRSTLAELRPGGELAGYIGTLEDVTAQQRAEEDLRANELWLSTVTNAIPAMIAYVDKNQRYRFINKQREEFWHTPAERVIGHTVEEVRGASAYAGVKAYIERALSGETVEFERDLTAHGVPKVVRSTFVPHFSESGAVLGYLVLAYDVTERARLQASLRLYELAIKQSSNGITIVDAQQPGQPIVYFNPAFAEMTGYAAEEILGHNCRFLQRGDRDQPGLAALKSAIAQGRSAQATLRNYRKDGSLFWNELVIYPVHDENGKLTHFVGVQEDITARRRADEALFLEKELSEVTLNSIGDAVITTDTNGRISYLNPVAERMTGWNAAEASGQPLSVVFNVVDAETREPVLNPIDVALASNSTMGLPMNTMLLRRDGSEASIEDSAAPIHDRDGRVIGGVLVFHDVTESRSLAIKMTHLAQHDALTGLPNRVLLNDRLAQSIARARRNDFRVAVLFIDVDRFKQVNDTLGHSVGDELLKQMAARLQTCIRASDTVCRQGGDEFVILLGEVRDAEAVGQVAQRVLATGERPYLIDGHEIHSTVSVGISVYPDDGDDVDSMIKCADAAMYSAKELGRNNSQFFTRNVNDRLLERFQLEGRMRGALARNEFFLVYQPKVDLPSGKIVGAEALVRWQDPERGMISPAQFIPVAEDSGLIMSLGKWILTEVCRQNRAWQDAGYPPQVMAVNVSPVQFVRKSFLSEIQEALRDSGMQARYLELELTETALLRDLDRTAGVLLALRQMGVRVSLDDFGTGYSSLSYLKRFPIDTIKVDQSFVRDIIVDPDDAAIVSAVIGMAKSLKRTVVAEGVETAEQLHWLRDQGCHQMQGYYFSKPLPAEEYTQRFFRGNLMKTLSMEWLGHFR